MRVGSPRRPRRVARPKRFAQQNLDAGRIHSARADEKKKGSPQGTALWGADMQVYSQNDGPVTILFDTDQM